MAKQLATHWRVVVNSVHLSDHAFDVQISDEKEKVDVSGFGGTKEWLSGQRDQTVTVSFLNDPAAASVDATLRPLYEGGSVFPFYVQRDSRVGTSSTNLLFGGSASLYSYSPQASLNEREELEVEFAPATSAGFSWGTVAP